MANIYTYWCEGDSELVNMTHVAIPKHKGCRIELVFDSSHDLFTHGIPEDVYKMNDAKDGIELKT